MNLLQGLIAMFYKRNQTGHTAPAPVNVYADFEADEMTLGELEAYVSYRADVWHNLIVTAYSNNARVTAIYAKDISGVEFEGLDSDALYMGYELQCENGDVLRGFAHNTVKVEFVGDMQ